VSYIWVISLLKGDYESTDLEMETLSFDRAIVMGMLMEIAKGLRVF